MNQRTDRRTFLGQSIAAAAALAAPARALALCPGTTDATARVIVVGAGLAGLVAAHELRRAGHRVSVLEAQTRPGGRVLTLRHFAEGLYADAGAARIPSNHEWTMRYVKEFGLPLKPFYPAAGLYVRAEGGRREEVKWKSFTKTVERRVGVHLGEAAEWFRIEGGNDLLPRAFAERLGERVVYGARVSGVEQDGGGVRVRVARGGGEETMAADYVVCAVPFAVLGRVEFRPALSPEKRAAADKMIYVSAGRQFFQFRRRFWEGGRANGFALTDEPAEVWPASFGQPGARGLLQSYLRGDASDAAMRRPEAERTSAALERLERLFPGARENFETTAAKFWAEDEWARCAWGLVATTEQLKAAARPEGRVHFAGEHASAAPSWMQGALESGHRAASEIAEKARAVNRET
jgi:monoamine oxidase